MIETRSSLFLLIPKNRLGFGNLQIHYFQKGIIKKIFLNYYGLLFGNYYKLT